MPAIRNASTVVLFAACVCAAPLALYKSHASSADPIQQPAHVRPAAETMTVDFPGGTAADYIMALRRADPQANIVVLGDLSRITLAPVQLKGVELISALRVLNYVGPEQGNVKARIQVDEQRGGLSEPVYTVVTEGKASSSNLMAHTVVISMADVLGDQLRPEDALAAIEAAIALVGITKPAPAIKFHEETSLLLANGTAEHIDAIRQVVRQLQEAAMNRRQIETARTMNERNVASLEENQKLVREVIEWRTRCELLDQTIRQMRDQHAALESQMRRTQEERDALRREVANLMITPAGPSRP